MVDQVASHTEVVAFNDRYKQMAAIDGNGLTVFLSVIWMNLALTNLITAIAPNEHGEPNRSAGTHSVHETSGTERECPVAKNAKARSAVVFW